MTSVFQRLNRERVGWPRHAHGALPRTARRVRREARVCAWAAPRSDHAPCQRRAAQPGRLDHRRRERVARVRDGEQRGAKDHAAWSLRRDALRRAGARRQDPPAPARAGEPPHGAPANSGKSAPPAPCSRMTRGERAEAAGTRPRCVRALPKRAPPSRHSGQRASAGQRGAVRSRARRAHEPQPLGGRSARPTLAAGLSASSTADGARVCAPYRQPCLPRRGASHRAALVAQAAAEWTASAPELELSLMSPHPRRRGRWMRAARLPPPAARATSRGARRAARLPSERARCRRSQTAAPSGCARPTRRMTRRASDASTIDTSGTGAERP